MRRVVVIGSKGQLGSDLVRELGDQERVLPLSHHDLEICDHARTREVLTRLRPNAVINTAAYHRVDDCEDHESRAFRTNADAVLNLGQVCNDLDALLVHVSTDYVFGGDGGRTSPYTEEDPPSPVNVYGVSKLAGENLLRAE
ncbi:MAG: sugar nucleotide-binding protein, partial [Candidatus Aminicenantes bacterium]|nr:sugar nucleotide-binding protein [Candidatus Aminicenantes bacterium]